jgi:hypothetical protein
MHDENRATIPANGQSNPVFANIGRRIFKLTDGEAQD